MKKYPNLLQKPQNFLSTLSWNFQMIFHLLEIMSEYKIPLLIHGEVNDKKIILSENQSTYIPLGSKHRLSNEGNEKLIIIEVQSGKYLGEDDIVRFSDIYGRETN